MRQRSAGLEAARTIAILTIIVGGVLSICCSENREGYSEPTRDETAYRIMYNAEVEFTEEGKPAAGLHAGRLLFFDKEHRTFGYDLLVDFFDKTGEKAARLTADSGWVDNRSRQVTVYGQVHLLNKDGTELWTDSLSYNPKIDRIMTGAEVRINRAGEYITGIGLNSDLEFTDIRIEQNVSGRLREN